MVRATVLIFSFLSAGFVWAQGFDGVLLTSHNLFPGGPDSLVRDVCVVCHIEPIIGVSPRVAEALPMGVSVEGEASEGISFIGESSFLSDADTVAMPLWDTQSSAMSFLPLARTTTNTSKYGEDHRPYGPSMDCLTCHDGVLGSEIHLPPYTNGTSVEELVKKGVNLSSAGNHPFAIPYPRKPTGEFVARNVNPSLKRYWSIPDRNQSGVVIPEGPLSKKLGLGTIDVEDPLQAAGLVRTFMGDMHCGSCHDPHLDLHEPFLRVVSKDLCLVCHQR